MISTVLVIWTCFIRGTIFISKDCHIFHSIDWLDVKYCNSWHLSVSVSFGQSIMFPSFVFFPISLICFQQLRSLFSILGEFDWCQWRQSAGGSNPSLPTGDTLRVFKCPWSPRFPAIRWRLRCRAFLRQRGSHLCGWLGQRNARNTGREKFNQQTHPSPSCHIGSAASSPG